MQQLQEIAGLRRILFLRHELPQIAVVAAQIAGCELPERAVGIVARHGHLRTEGVFASGAPHQKSVGDTRTDLYAYLPGQAALCRRPRRRQQTTAQQQEYEQRSFHHHSLFLSILRAERISPFSMRKRWLLEKMVRAKQLCSIHSFGFFLEKTVRDGRIVISTLKRWIRTASLFCTLNTPLLVYYQWMARR